MNWKEIFWHTLLLMCSVVLIAAVYIAGLDHGAVIERESANVKLQMCHKLVTDTQ